MKRQPPPISDEQLDTLLNNHHSLQPPEDFAVNIMQNINEQAEITIENTPATQNAWWQWLALLAASTPGIAQAFALMSGIWQVSSAG